MWKELISFISFHSFCGLFSSSCKNNDSILKYYLCQCFVFKVTHPFTEPLLDVIFVENVLLHLWDICCFIFFAHFAAWLVFLFKHRPSPERNSNNTNWRNKSRAKWCPNNKIKYFHPGVTWWFWQNPLYGQVYLHLARTPHTFIIWSYFTQGELSSLLQTHEAQFCPSLTWQRVGRPLVPRSLKQPPDLLEVPSFGNVVMETSGRMLRDWLESGVHKIAAFKLQCYWKKLNNVRNTCS